MGRCNSLSALTALLGLAACNAVFEIGVTRGPDGDADGRSDTNDNCVLVANSDQADRDSDELGDACDPCDGPQTGNDSDGDGLDDACDACPDGSNHDEDEDGALDGCDACPGVIDDGSDSDGDGVGDACDASPGTANRRVFFDGFGPPRADWRTWLRPWVANGDAYRPLEVGGVGAWNLASQVAGRGWWMEVAVATPIQPPDGDQVGFYVRELPGASHILSCFAEWDLGTWTANYDVGNPIALTAVTTFRFRALDVGYECTVNGRPVFVDDNELTPDYTYLPTLVSFFGADFLWVDVVAGP